MKHKIAVDSGVDRIRIYEDEEDDVQKYDVIHQKTYTLMIGTQAISHLNFATLKTITMVIERLEHSLEGKGIEGVK